MFGPDLGESKEELVESIVDIDRRNFKNWISDSEKSRELDLPTSALRYVLIPKRILELADDPSRVGLIVDTHKPDEISAYVVEHKKEPVTNKESYEAYMAAREEFLRQARAYSSETSPDSRLYLPPRSTLGSVPLDVDGYHIEYKELIESGLMNFNDYFTNKISLVVTNNPEVLYVAGYFDRHELRNKGVAKSFYSRLPEVARDLGFRIIKGWNSPDYPKEGIKGNSSFFIEKLGRHTLKEVRPELRSLFIDPNQDDLSFAEDEFVQTLQFLYRKDEEKYLIPTK